MLSSNVQSTNLLMDCRAWRFWTMRQSNGFSAPPSSDSVTRFDSSHDLWWLGLDSSHVDKNGDSTGVRVTFCTEWLDSCHSQWLETRVEVIFTKSLSSCWTNPVRLHTEKWAVVASVMIKIDGNFLSCLSSRAMPHFKDQVSPTCIEGDLRLCFHWEFSRAQYSDT